MEISELLLAKAAGERVSVTTLVKLDFDDEPLYAWTGVGLLRAASQEWRGLGEVAQVSALPLGIGDSAGMATFALSGVDQDTVRIARSEAGKVEGRAATVWRQFLSGPHRALLDPLYMGTWIMMSPRFAFARNSRTISVSARSEFDDRKTLTQEYYSDARQRELYPDDVFHEFISQMVEGLVVNWPRIA